MSYILIKDGQPVIRDGVVVLVPNASGNDECECCGGADCTEAHAASSGTSATVTWDFSGSYTAGDPGTACYSDCASAVASADGDFPENPWNFDSNGTASPCCTITYFPSAGGSLVLKRCTTETTDHCGITRAADTWYFEISATLKIICGGTNYGNSVFIGSGACSVTTPGGILTASGTGAICGTTHGCSATVSFSI